MLFGYFLKSCIELSTMHDAQRLHLAEGAELAAALLFKDMLFTNCSSAP